MNIRKKLMSAALGLSMALSLGVPAFAAPSNSISASGGTGASTVDLTAAASTFSVTVPTTLAINVAADGTVTCATEAKITNNSNGQVEVTNVAVTGKNGWSVVDYTDDLKSVAVNTKQLALKINDKKAVSEISQIAATFGASGVINGGSSSSNISYDANIPAQSAAITEAENVVEIVFTVGWHTVS